MSKKSNHGRGESGTYVIQHHAARSDHYDFRIEIDGVLKSWSVPKGPSLDPKTKRLAIPTEDHALSYARKEGIIEEGHYGAGTVMVWDIGTFYNIKEKDGEPVDLLTCYKQGTIEIFVEGKKLRGAFALIRTSIGGKKNWLLIKMDDEYANRHTNPVTSQPESALSGKSIKEIAKLGEIIRCS